MRAEEVYKAYLNRRELVSGGTIAPHWTADGEALWYAEGAPGDTVITRVELATGNAKPLFDADWIRAALGDATGHAPAGGGLPFDSFVSLKDGAVAFRYGDAWWHLNSSNYALSRIDDIRAIPELSAFVAASEPRMWSRLEYMSQTADVPEQLSPSREWFASVRDNDIVLRPAAGGLARRLTTNGSPDRVWEIESLRIKTRSGRQNTYGAVSPWSPDSLTLFAYRRDITGVFRIPRMHWLKPFEDVELTPFQKAGARMDVIQPVFVDVRSGRQIPVALDDIEDRYIQLLAWHPEGREAFFIVYTRDFKRLDIFAASRETGAVRTVMTETVDTFIKVHITVFLCGEHGFNVLPDGSGFLWQSTRDGWNHIYHYDREGRLIGQLTCGDWPVYDVQHIGGDGLVYFTAAIDTARPYDVHVCRVPLKGGKVEQLTEEKGIHMPVFAPGGEAFVDTHSAVDRPTRSDLVRADGKRLRVLSRMDISGLERVGYRPAEEFTVKAADGITDLWGVMYKPFDFDPARSYPVIEYIYNGPQTIETQRFFAVDSVRYHNLPWALAQLGYIVYCLDARGTPGRSKAFQDAVYGNWKAGVPDHIGAVAQLCARHPWMDRNRVGITGHSWGGYFSTCCLMEGPEVYHAAVSYEPGYDPWHYVLSEPYLDLPHRNRAAYDDADLIRQAAKVKRPLMIVAGTDYDVTCSSIMKMERALIDAGVDHEYVLVPEANHGFVGVEEDYLFMKLTGWFDRHIRNRAV